MPEFLNESTEYRKARDELLKAEVDLRAQVERVAAMRREMPLGGLVEEDYAFDEIDDNGQVKTVRFSELFEDSKTSLFVYSFMYGPNMENACPMCSSIIDGLNGNAHHITERVNLVVVARSPIDRIMAFAKERSWDNLRVLSCANNSYGLDYFGEDAGGNQMPMANVFVKTDRSIHHFWGTEMLYANLEGQPRHVDLMWPLWNVLDTTPEGRGEDWYPPLRS